MASSAKKLKLEENLDPETEVPQVNPEQNETIEYDLENVETLDNLQFKVDKKVWNQVKKQMTDLQKKNPDMFKNIMTSVKYLITRNRAEKGGTYKNPFRDFLQIFEPYVAYFLLSISTEKPLNKKQFKDPLKCDFNIGKYFEFACNKQYFALAHLVFNYAMKIDYKLVTLLLKTLE